jgi:hypothetical protein
MENCFTWLFYYKIYLKKKVISSMKSGVSLKLPRLKAIYGLSDRVSFAVLADTLLLWTSRSTRAQESSTLGPQYLKKNLHFTKETKSYFAISELLARWTHESPMVSAL